MAIHMPSTSSSKSTKSSTSSSKEAKMAASTAAPARYVVKILSKGGRIRAYLGTLRQPKAMHLTEAEKNALKAVPAFGGPRRTKFEFYYQPALEEVMPGYAWYWLCDVDDLEDREEVEALVDSVLAKPAARKAQGASGQPKAASQGSKDKNTKGQAMQAAKAKERAASRKEEVVLG